MLPLLFTECGKTAAGRCRTAYNMHHDIHAAEVALYGFSYGGATLYRCQIRGNEDICPCF
ncbi:hypothetical protein D3C80_1155530 [compost metagenome]